jgi:hypothetical protein
MNREIKKMERDLMTLYCNLKRIYPKLHCLSFSVAEYEGRKPHSDGFIHISEGCTMFDGLPQLNAMVERKITKNRILYQKFDEVLK